MAASRRSRQRELLTDILKNTKSHPSADAIYETARKAAPNISLGTVYRNLAQLSESGAVKKLSVGDECERYDGDTSPHAHFFCRRCKRVFDIACDFSPALINRAAEMTDAAISDCTVTFSGVCAECGVKSGEQKE